MKINLDIIKPRYCESFVPACVAGGLFSEKEKNASKRRNKVPLAAPLYCNLSRVVVWRMSNVWTIPQSQAQSLLCIFFSPSSTSSLHRIKSKMASAMVSKRLLLLKASMSNTTIDKRYLWSRPLRIDSRLLIFCKAAKCSKCWPVAQKNSFLRC